MCIISDLRPFLSVLHFMVEYFCFLFVFICIIVIEHAALLRFQVLHCRPVSVGFLRKNCGPGFDFGVFMNE